MGPGPGYAVDATADWYVLVGDDAALPAIETLLEAIPPSTRVTALIARLIDTAAGLAFAQARDVGGDERGRTDTRR